MTPIVAERPQTGPIVTIQVDNKPYEIHRGRQSVSEIKRVAGVPQAFELEEVVSGKLVPLSDEGGVTLKGGEVFVSHPKDSGAS